LDFYLNKFVALGHGSLTLSDFFDSRGGGKSIELFTKGIVRPVVNVERASLSREKIGSIGEKT
jgi:hypothetical protein